MQTCRHAGHQYINIILPSYTPAIVIYRGIAGLSLGFVCLVRTADCFVLSTDTTVSLQNNVFYSYIYM